MKKENDWTKAIQETTIRSSINSYLMYFIALKVLKPFPYPEGTKTLMTGSSTIRHFSSDSSIPQTAPIHAYSTTQEKNNLLQKYQPSKIDTVFIQDNEFDFY